MVVPKIAKLDTCELGAPHNLPAQWLKLLVEGLDNKNYWKPATITRSWVETNQHFTKNGIKSIPAGYDGACAVYRIFLEILEYLKKTIIVAPHKTFAQSYQIANILNTLTLPSFFNRCYSQFLACPKDLIWRLCQSPMSMLLRHRISWQTINHNSYRTWQSFFVIGWERLRTRTSLKDVKILKRLSLSAELWIIFLWLACLSPLSK